MDPAELAEIASSIDIEWFSEDYQPGDPPSDSKSGIQIVSSGCCHTAQWIRGECCDYVYKCQKSLEYIADESITVSTKIIKTKKYSAPSARVDISLEGHCIPIIENLATPPNDACDDVYNCGTVTRSVQYKEIIHDVVGYDLNEIRVSIYKRSMTCEYGGSLDCKYVVEVAQSVDAIAGGNIYSSFQRVSSVSNVHQCCQTIEGAECSELKYHDQEPNCNDAPLFDYGANQRYWMVKYKVFDSIEDIPPEIVFDLEDESWPCGRIAFCGIDPGVSDDLVSGSYVCFQFESDYPSFTGGTILNVAYMYGCQFCLDSGLECSEGGGGFDGVPCVNPPIPPLPCLCDHDGWTGRNLSIPGSVVNATESNFQTVTDAIWVSPEGCFELVYPGYGILWANDCDECDLTEQDGWQAYAVPLALRTECNWFDCGDCYFTYWDPRLPPYQFKLNNVDAYSFSQSTPVFESRVLCVPFRRVKLTLNP